MNLINWVDLLMNCLVFGIMLFFINYIKKKGENLATEESISRVTKEVESVKFEFTKEGEYLRSILQVNSQLQFSMKNESIKAIVECHKMCRIWFDSLSHYSLHFKVAHENNVYRSIESIHILYSNFIQSQAMIQLYIQDIIFIDKVLEIRKEVLEIQILVTESLLEYDLMHSGFDIKKANNINLVHKLGEYTKNFNEKRLSMIRDIRPKMLSFDKLCYEQLNRILQNSGDLKL